MPGKHKFLPCPECSQVKRSDNMTRHLRTHNQGPGLGVELHDESAGVLADTRREVELHNEIPTGAVTDKYTWKDKGVTRNHSPLFP